MRQLSLTCTALLASEHLRQVLVTTHAKTTSMPPKAKEEPLGGFLGFNVNWVVMNGFDRFVLWRSAILCWRLSMCIRLPDLC